MKRKNKKSGGRRPAKPKLRKRPRTSRAGRKQRKSAAARTRRSKLKRLAKGKFRKGKITARRKRRRSGTRAPLELPTASPAAPVPEAPPAVAAELLPPPRPDGSRLRILVWASTMSIGGGTRVLANLLPALARQSGVEQIQLVIPPGNKFTSLLDPAAYPNLAVREFGEEIDSPNAQPILQSADVVYFFWPHGADCRPVPKPTVTTFQDVTILDYPAPFASGTDLRRYWEQSKGWVEQSTAIVAAAHDVKHRLASHFGDRANGAYTIPFIHSSKLTDAPIGRTGTAARLPEEYLIYPANTSPHKNHYNLFVAYSKFARRKQVPLVLMGYLTENLSRTPPDYPELPYLSTLTSLIRRRGLRHGEDFIALGFIPDEDILPVMKHARALIMPSLAEGGGIPLFEAMSLGVPVLCSDIPVFREHVANEGRSDSVLWFDPDSPDSIAEAMNRLEADYGRYKSLAASTNSHSRETWDDTARKYVDVFYEAHRRFHGY